MRTLAIWAILCISLFANEAAGLVKNCSGEAYIARSGVSHIIKQGEKLYVSDTIKTGKDGAVGIILSDNTLLSVGKNSAFSLKEYLFHPGDKQVSFTGHIAKGTIACVSGLIAKMNPRAMKIESKTATIGIRGTYFVVEADE